MTFRELFMLVADKIYAYLPQKRPSRDQLKALKLVAHRGDTQAVGIIENSFAAFDRALAAGVWGLEFDIRWTRDCEPVVFHDADLMRVFHRPEKVSELTLPQLREQFPQIPSFKEVVERYGGRAHLMIELKDDPLLNAENAKKLELALQHFKPIQDYHFMAIEMQSFKSVRFVPAKALLPIAIFNVQDLVNLSLSQEMAGVSGHYFLISNSAVKALRKEGQGVGTGFSENFNLLCREMARGVEWIFSNHSVELMNEVQKRLSCEKPF